MLHLSDASGASSTSSIYAIYQCDDGAERRREARLRDRRGAVAALRRGAHRASGGVDGDGGGGRAGEGGAQRRVLHVLDADAEGREPAGQRDGRGKLAPPPESIGIELWMPCRFLGRSRPEPLFPIGNEAEHNMVIGNEAEHNGIAAFPNTPVSDQPLSAA
eukprot:gene17176-biopygen5108